MLITHIYPLPIVSDSLNLIEFVDWYVFNDVRTKNRTRLRQNANL